MKKLLGRELPIKWLLHDLAYLDIKSTLIMINKGLFKGTKLSWFTEKEDHGNKVPIWYKQKEYDKIVVYILSETEGFIDAYKFLKKKLPPL